MKWLGAWLVGVISGMAAGLGILYFNPLTDESLSSADGTAMLYYELGPSTMAFTHGEVLPFDYQPSEIPKLWESTIDNVMLAMFALRDRQGRAVAVASRASKLSSKTNPVTDGLIIAEHWLVTVPGAGSYFIESAENVWPLLRDTVVATNFFKQAWSRSVRYQLTAGPQINRAARVTGTSGRFVGASGTAVNTVELADYALPSQLRNPLAGQLSLNIVRPGLSQIDNAAQTPTSAVETP